MANWRVVLAGPLKAGGQVEGLVHIVARDKLVQPVREAINCEKKDWQNFLLLLFYYFIKNI